MIHPLLLGRGKRPFREESDSVKLRLVDSRTTSTGVLILGYVPA